MANYRESPSLKPATNGIILSWSEYSSKPSKGENEYDSRQYLGYKEKVFEMDAAQEGFEEFLAICKECGQIEDSEKEPEEEVVEVEVKEKETPMKPAGKAMLVKTETTPFE